MTNRLSIFAALVVGICGGFAASDAQAYQQNYTCQGDPSQCLQGETFAPIAWDHQCILFYLDRAGSPDFRPAGAAASEAPGATKKLEQAVQRSFAAWSAPSCTGVSLIYGGLVDPNEEQPGQSQNVVSFQTRNWPHSSKTVFATTLVTYNPNDGVISDADIHVNNEFYAFSAAPKPPPGHADLENTLTHEVGHFLGIAHSQEPEATMFGSATLGETKKRTLHEDDIAVLCRYYPAGPDDALCGSTPQPPGKHDQVDERPDTPDPPGKDDLEDDFWTAPYTPNPNAGGCHVTGDKASATLGLWMPIFGFLALGWTYRRRRSRPASGRDK